MSFDSIIKAGKKVYLHHKISLNLGSSIEIVDKHVLTENNIEQLQSILNGFNANILGIDVICETGVHVDFSLQKCIFLELNSRPFLAMADYPRYGKIEDLSEFYQELNSIAITDNKIF